MNAAEKILTPLTLSADHPAFAGHFPGTPIVPGVVLLDEAFTAIGRSRGIDFSRGELASAKFHSPVLPGEALSVEHTLAAHGTVRFTVRVGDRIIAAGAWVPDASKSRGGA